MHPPSVPLALLEFLELLPSPDVIELDRDPLPTLNAVALCCHFCTVSRLLKLLDGERIGAWMGGVARFVGFVFLPFALGATGFTSQLKSGAPGSEEAVSMASMTAKKEKIHFGILHAKKDADVERG